jgi:arylsulfatase A-like enzyme
MDFIMDKKVKMITMIKWPFRIILPSILDWAGVSIPEYLQGNSLAQILSDLQSTIHDYVVSESVGVGGKIGTGHRMVRMKDYKYMRSDVNDQALFNLKNDPYEQNNLIHEEEHQEELSTLKGYFKTWENLVGNKPVSNEIDQ